jgi:hypothetical protein
MESSADLKLAFFSQKDKFFPWVPLGFGACIPMNPML